VVIPGYLPPPTGQNTPHYLPGWWNSQFDDTGCDIWAELRAGDDVVALPPHPTTTPCCSTPPRYLPHTRNTWAVGRTPYLPAQPQVLFPLLPRHLPGGRGRVPTGLLPA